MNDDVNHQLILPERTETREPTRTAARALAPTREAVAMTPAEMLASAVQSGANIETLERLIALQERWEAANARKAFDAARLAAQVGAFLFFMSGVGGLTLGAFLLLNHA